MDIIIEDNPNCSEVGHVVFNEMEAKAPIKGLIIGSANGDMSCDIVGVDEGGQITQAFAQKINDSGEGMAYLIFGGNWGIRMKPKDKSGDPWDLNNDNQIGEAYKIYGNKEDIEFA